MWWHRTEASVGRHADLLGEPIAALTKRLVRSPNQQHTSCRRLLIALPDARRLSLLPSAALRGLSRPRRRADKVRVPSYDLHEYMRFP